MTARRAAAAALATACLVAAASGAPAAGGSAVTAGAATTVGAASTVVPMSGEYGTYTLAGTWVYWNAPPPANTPVTIDDQQLTALGGYIAFRVATTSTAPECYGKYQRFRFSWRFSTDVTSLAGSQDTPLFIMSTLWEGDSGDPACVDVNPFMWIRTGGHHGPTDADWANSDTFRLAFVNQGGENRVYFKGEGSSSPTVFMNAPYYPTAGIEIMPSIPGLGNPLGYYYVWQRQADVRAPVVKVRAVSHRGKLKVDVNPNLGSGYWRFQVQRQLPDGSWTTLPRVYRTQGSKETRTLNLAKGWYRVVTLPDRGYGSTTSAPVWLKR